MSSRCSGRLEPGITELTCHAGDHVNLASSYRLERQAEVAALTDNAAAAAVKGHGIVLCSFATAPLGRPRWISGLKSLICGQFSGG